MNLIAEEAKQINVAASTNRDFFKLRCSIITSKYYSFYLKLLYHNIVFIVVGTDKNNKSDLLRRYT